MFYRGFFFVIRPLTHEQPYHPLIHEHPITLHATRLYVNPLIHENLLDPNTALKQADFEKHNFKHIFRVNGNSRGIRPGFTSIKAIIAATGLANEMVYNNPVR